MSPLFIGLKYVSLKHVGLKDVSLKDVVVPENHASVLADLTLLTPPCKFSLVYAKNGTVRLLKS